MPVGTCKMCVQTKALVSSHLMPASLYDYCRTGKQKPVKVGGGFVLSTDRQAQDYLLCKGCEDILNRGGESWIADKLATWERAFPLYDLLTKLPPDFDEAGMAVYFASRNPEINVGKVAHFALGIFWKAPVHAWSGSHAEPRIELGPYSDRIRTWLRGESEFPKHIYLVTSISRPQRAQITLNDPYEGVHQGWRSFWCCPN
jgi:hypothetical protein